MAKPKMNTSARIEFQHVGGKLTPVHVSATREPDYNQAGPTPHISDHKPDDDGTLEELVGHLLSEHGNDDLQNQDMQDDQAFGKDQPGQHSDGDKVGLTDPDQDEEDMYDENNSDDEEEEDVKKSIFAGTREFEKGIPVEQICKKHLGFAKLTAKLASKGGVKNPGALAAHIGREKYGKKKMASHAASGKPLKESMKKSMGDAVNVTPEAEPGASRTAVDISESLANAQTEIETSVADYVKGKSTKQELEGKLSAALKSLPMQIQIDEMQ